MLAHIVVLLGLMAGEAVRPTGATPENQLVFQLAALAAEERPLHGRFLHFTDIHPDRYYTPGAKVNDACHGKDRDAQVKEESQSSRKKYSSSRTESRTKIKKDRAGFWGTGNSVCDSPTRLVTATLDWLARNWMVPSEDDSETFSDGVDFILWTGDTARHDIDFTHPRSAEEIFGYNRWALEEVEKRFPGVPVVPSIGNNDIIPHNIMFPGPNQMTKAFEDIWAKHIPESEREAFRQGGYFSTEVIPGDLAVISLNTLYWYDNNAAVRGCKGKYDPGSIHLDWLEDKLIALRNASIQSHLIGHVPPTAGNYFPHCYDRYTDIVLRYQDSIVGQHFGHMNIDSWFLQEEGALATEDEAFNTCRSSMQSMQRPIFHAETLASDLRKEFDSIPTRQKANLDAYMPFFAAPSVVPTYFPAVRVWTYNATRAPLLLSRAKVDSTIQEDGEVQEEKDQEEEEENTICASDSQQINLQRSHRRPKHGKKKHKKHAHLPRHASEDSPSRKNGYRTMLGYSQWVLDIERANRKRANPSEDKGVEYQLEYTTYNAKTLWSEFRGEEAAEIEAHGHVPVPKALLQKQLNRLGLDSPHGSSGISWWKRRKAQKKIKRWTEYGLPSITVDHVLEWGRELAGSASSGKRKKAGVWKRFVDRIYTESGATD